MKLRALGVAGSASPGHNVSSVRLGTAWLVDAGSCASELSLDDQAEITDVLLTHAHLDHVMQLQLLCENTLHRRATPLRVHGMPEALDRFRTHLSNGVIYPDFTTLPPGRPGLSLHPLAPGATLRLGALAVTTVPLVHPGGCVAFAFEGSGGVFLWAGDTGPAPALREAMRGAGSRLLAAGIEVSFPNRLEALALATGHLTPGLLATLVAGLEPPPPVLVHHMKPSFRDEIVSEIGAAGIPRVRVLEQGDEVELALNGPST